MGKMIDIDDFYKRYMFHAENKAEAEFNQIISEIKKTEAIPKDYITKAIDKVEEYICDVETNTVKAQGMAQALDIIEQVLGGAEDGKID